MARKIRTAIFLMGDAPLVEEFGSTCRDAGITLTCKFNQPAIKRTRKPLKVSSTIPRNAEYCFELTNSDKEIKRKNLQWLAQRSPQQSILVSSSVLTTLLEQATWIDDDRRLVGMSALPTLLSQRLIELAPTRNTDQSAVGRVSDFFRKIGKETSIVQDRIGMVMPRILCMLINEASFALSENIASPHDIDAAMKLGTNYPLGPIEWGDNVGFKNVVDVLDALYNDLHEERYRVAPLLRQLATGKKWW